MTTAIIKQAARGQITVPAKFRKALKVNTQTVYQADLRDSSILLTPIAKQAESGLRDYSRRDIERFLVEDKIDEKTARRARALLARF